mmetsp:Transcript_40956/g.135667  ORF Transcript_40956/g.135667 Transcript_40956/m.135667 type:complete len:332 (-) Transcript_40956:545-1540(-)
MKPPEHAFLGRHGRRDDINISHVCCRGRFLRGLFLRGRHLRLPVSRLPCDDVLECRGPLPESRVRPVLRRERVVAMRHAVAPLDLARPEHVQASVLGRRAGDGDEDGEGRLALPGRAGCEPLRALLSPREQAHADHDHDESADEDGEVQSVLRQAGEFVKEEAAEDDVGTDDHHGIQRHCEGRLARAESPVEEPQLSRRARNNDAEREPGDPEVDAGRTVLADPLLEDGGGEDLGKGDGECARHARPRCREQRQLDRVGRRPPPLDRRARNEDKHGEEDKGDGRDGKGKEDEASKLLLHLWQRQLGLGRRPERRAEPNPRHGDEERQPLEV